jgi:hypothetical protein
MLFPGIDSIHQRVDGFGLVAHGLKGGLKFEIHRLFV